MEKWYIKHDELGLFVGEFIGLAMWTVTVGVEGSVPEHFNTKNDAEQYINSWVLSNDQKREFNVLPLTDEQVKGMIVSYTKAN
jgi:hypothetical protein